MDRCRPWATEAVNHRRRHTQKLGTAWKERRQQPQGYRHLQLCLSRHRVYQGMAGAVTDPPAHPALALDVHFLLAQDEYIVPHGSRAVPDSRARDKAINYLHEKGIESTLSTP